MALYLTRTFQKNFERIPNKIRPQVKKSLEKLSNNPHCGKKLKGALDGEWSLRIGDYRIIYFCDEQENIWLETIRHRKDFYKKPGELA
jgi:mRNA interferase RelE/StbE